MSNPTNTQTLQTLFETSPELRDESWRQRFYAAAPDAALMTFEPQIETGPDGFPYFQFAIPGPKDSAQVCVADAIGHCLENGLGIVIHHNAQRDGAPGWVFSYGQLLVYAMLGAFDAKREEPPADGENQAPAEGNRKILMASPSDSFFPPVAQKAMADFLRNRLGHPDPKVLLVVDPNEWPSHGLMFNLSVSDFDNDPQRLTAVQRTLHWFLPETYCAILTMPAGWTDESFTPLASA